MGTQYATLSELTIYGIPAVALGTLSTTQQTDALIAASGRVDSYLRGRYALPLVAWGIEITQAVCKIAAFDLMNLRGYNPASGADRNIADRFSETIIWLRDVQHQAAHPDVTASTPSIPTQQGPSVITSSAVATHSGATAPTRGW